MFIYNNLEEDMYISNNLEGSFTYYRIENRSKRDFQNRRNQPNLYTIPQYNLFSTNIR